MFKGGMDSDWVSGGFVPQAVYGANRQRRAMDKASEARVGGFDEAIGGYGGVRDEYRPYMQAGTQGVTSLQKLAADPSSIKETPGYEFRLSEGLRSLSQAAASIGKYFSGQTMKRLEEYGQDYATKELDDSWKRNISLANLGLGATQGYEASSLNLADMQAGRGQARARRYEDESKYIAGAEQAGREMAMSWFGGQGFSGSMAKSGSMGGGMGGMGG